MREQQHLSSHQDSKGVTMGHMDIAKDEQPSKRRTGSIHTASTIPAHKPLDQGETWECLTVQTRVLKQGNRRKYKPYETR